jgi:recombinational DNA repair protein (RecF pathway)
MAYETYTTEALVCGTFNRNTADRNFLLFTKEAGMLYADARSVREERSRQRYALQEFSLVRVSLIKGKYGWKIGSVEAVKNYYHEAISREARGSVVTLYRLLRRFVRGEEADKKMFAYVCAGLELVTKDVPNRKFVEMVLSVTILSFLGYVDVQEIPAVIRECAPNQITRQYETTVAQKIEALYTQALAVSHL